MEGMRRFGFSLVGQNCDMQAEAWAESREAGEAQLQAAALRLIAQLAPFAAGQALEISGIRVFELSPRQQAPETSLRGER